MISFLGQWHKKNPSEILSSSKQLSCGTEYKTELQFCKQ